MTDRDSSQTYYAQALARAAELPTDDLRRHASIADMEGYPHCRQCFCCACWDVLQDREKLEAEVFKSQRLEAFEARYAKIQAEKEADRKRLGLE